MTLQERTSAGGTVQKTARGWRLEIPAGDAGTYRLAQLDDYAGLPRRSFPIQRPAELSLRARASSSMTAGTWGFGFWNDPFGLGIAQGGQILRLPALPDALWFFGASNRSSLALHDGLPASGFYTQALSSPRFSPRLAEVGLGLLTNRLRARRVLGEIIAEAGAQIRLDPGEAHMYRIKWAEESSAFSIDGTEVLRTGISPRGPLGLVIWVDNQYAAFDLRRPIKWGMEANDSPMWIEIDELSVDAV